MATISFDDIQSGRSFEHWATQSQMDALIKNTEGMPRVANFFAELSNATKRTADVSKAILQASKANASYNSKQEQILEESLVEDKKQTKTSKQNTSNMGIASKALVQTANSMMRMKPGAGGFFGSMADSFEKLSTSADGNTATATKFSTILKGAGLVAGATAASLRVVGAMIEDEIKLRGNLTERGFTMSDNFLQVSTAALELGLGFNELEKVVDRGRHFFAAMGGTVGDGTRQFLSLFAGTQTALKEFGSFGMNPGETAELFQAYLDNQVASGRNFADLNRDTGQLVSNFVTLNKETAAVAQLTGTRREELLKARFNALNDNAFRAQMLRLRAGGEDGRATNIEGSLGSAASAMAPIANSEIGRSMQNNMVQQMAFLVSGRGYTMSPEAARLEAMFAQADQSGQLSNLYRGAVEGAASGQSPEETTNQVAAIIQRLNSTEVINRIAALSSNPGARGVFGDQLAELLNSSSRARSVGDPDALAGARNLEALGAQTEQTRLNNIALNNLNTNMAILVGNTQSGFRDGAMGTMNMTGGLQDLAVQLGTEATQQGIRAFGQALGTLSALPASGVTYGVGGILGGLAALTGADEQGEGGASLKDIRRELHDMRNDLRTFATRNQG